MILSIHKWTSHHNQILYSFLHYCESKNLDLNINYSKDIPNNGITLNHQGKQCLLDYSDDTTYIATPKSYDYYFKRSLALNTKDANVKPLNFQVNFAYKPLHLISKMPLETLLNKSSKVELARALDYYGIITNDSHRSKRLQKIWSNQISDHGGRIIFMTRLWDPARNADPEEKRRRALQNSFRINACRIIAKNFPNAITGLYPDDYAQKVAPDILLNSQQTKKANYLSELQKADTCLADDGLKDTPGWKIGEYAMMNKAIISTPIKTVVEEFEANKNYICLEHRNDYQNLPDVIHQLIKDKKYLELKEKNKKWTEKYLNPTTYVENILKTISHN